MGSSCSDLFTDTLLLGLSCVCIPSALQTMVRCSHGILHCAFPLCSVVWSRILRISYGFQIHKSRKEDTRGEGTRTFAKWHSGRPCRVRCQVEHDAARLSSPVISHAS